MLLIRVGNLKRLVRGVNWMVDADTKGMQQKSEGRWTGGGVCPDNLQLVPQINLQSVPQVYSAI